VLIADYKGRRKDNSGPVPGYGGMGRIRTKSFVLLRLPPPAHFPLLPEAQKRNYKTGINVDAEDDSRNGGRPLYIDPAGPIPR